MSLAVTNLAQAKLAKDALHARFAQLVLAEQSARRNGLNPRTVKMLALEQAPVQSAALSLWFAIECVESGFALMTYCSCQRVSA